LPIETVALARRWVTSTVAVIPEDLNALTTALRFDEGAPYLLCSFDNDGYLPYDEDAGLLPDLIALWIPDWFAMKPICSESSLLVDDPISRAEADWALAAGRPADAVSWHRTFVTTLETLKATGFDPRNELTSAFVLSRRYRLFSEALAAAGQEAEAAAVAVKRRDLVQFWKQKLPSSPFVEPALMR